MLLLFFVVFVAFVRRIGIEVVWQDERLTTVAASEILDETNVRAEDKKKYIDQVAAQLILEDYISRIKSKKVEE